MIEYIILFLVLVGFLIASFEDIKKREVYDYINYSLVFFVLIISIFDSILISSFDPIKYVGFGLLIGFLLGSLLFYLGIWGGGDAKFLIGFGASSYYLVRFTNIGINDTSIYFRILELISSGFSIFLNFVLKYLLVIDGIFLLLIVGMFFYTKRKKEYLNLINLFSIVLILFIGLYLNYSGLILILLGFIAFVLIFFADDEIFSSVYFRKNKQINKLNEGDRIDSSIKIKNESVVDFELGHQGLIREDILKIESSKFSDNNLIIVRKVLPYSLLVGLNYIIYMLKIITLNETNLTILAFLLKFLFYSFLAGGILAIGILFYFFIKNFKEVKIKFSNIEKIILGVIIFGSLIFGFFDTRFLFFLGFAFVILFIKVAKAVEGMIFVKKKKVKDIVLGDWIVQDIKIKDKLYYSEDDFKLGVNEKQLEKIIELSKKSKKLKELYVKDGLAFLPPLFVGFLILLLL